MPTLQEILAAKKLAQSIPPAVAPLIGASSSALSTDSSTDVATVLDKTVEEAPPLTTQPVSMLESIVAKANAEKEKAIQNLPTLEGSPIQSNRIIPDADGIIPRIEALEALSDDNLQDEMLLLKEALLQNPQASTLMLPEHIGMCVSALRRIVGETIAAASEKKPKKAKNLSAEEMDNLFKEL